MFALCLPESEVIVEFVIYGAGYRGKRLQNYLGSDRVVAYIDGNMDRRQHFFCGKPIISLEDYIKDYHDFFIIISPAYTDTNEIEEMLISREIFHFSKLDELPSEFKGYGSHGFIERCSSLTYKSEKFYYIYGFNAFSLMVYELLKERSKNVYIILSHTQNNDKVNWISYQYKDIVIEYDKVSEEDNRVIFLAVREDEGVVKQLFPNAEIIDAFDFSADLPEYYNEKLEPLKRAYETRRRCFIVATGPSLRPEDLQILNRNNDFCISMNKIYMHKSAWTPDAYVCVDSFLISESKDEIDNYVSRFKFIGDSNQEFWEKEHKDTYKIHTITQDSYNVIPKFSEDICQKVYGGSTVTYACIQIAVYLGFKEIYLLGVDCNYLKNSQNNHFYDSEVLDNKNHHEDRMVLAFQAAKKYADEHGIKIYNATRGGALEVFERVDFDSLFEGGQ